MEIVDFSEEKKLLHDEFKAFCNHPELNFSEEEKKQLHKAFEWAVKAHGEERRKSGEYYVWHCLDVAKIVALEIGLAHISVVAALLHESTKGGIITITQVESEFGAKVAEIIKALNRISGLYTKQVSLNTENFIKFLLTLSTDVRIILIKLADRLHNIRTLDSLAVEKQKKIARETHDLYAPIAHRLGLYNVKTELEELSMRYLQPEVYFTIKEKVENTLGEQGDYISKFIAPIEKQMKAMGLSYQIKWRTKSVYSIWKKMVKQNVDFEGVYDFFAIRIILNSELQFEKSECWQVYSIISDLYKPNPRRLRDWISSPKKSGYESLHTTVLGIDKRWVEVQIRTKRMDEIAEKGTAAHWKYKENKSEKSGEEWIKNIRELLENSEKGELDKVSDAKMQLYSDDVFIFTPKGDLYHMPKGTTVLDFAYRIHSAIGSRCIGAKIGNKVYPIKHVLQNGDQLEILTSKTQMPSQDWLSIVKTPQAKTKIRQALNEVKQEEAKQGKEILMRKVKNWKLNFSDEHISRLTAHYKLKTITDFYALIANEKIDLIDIRKLLSYKETDIEEKKPKGNVKETSIHKGKQKPNVLFEGEKGDMDFEFASCCNPIFGEPIFGFITVNGGVKIHAKRCPNAFQMQERYPYRLIEVRWNEISDSNYQRALIKISGEDTLGLLASITHLVANELKMNMSGLNIHTKDGTFDGSFVVYTSDKKQLDELIYKLQKIEGIVKVQRSFAE